MDISTQRVGWASRTTLPLHTPAGLALALFGAMATGALVDVSHPVRAALLPLVVAPFLAAVLLPFRATALLAAVSVALLLVLPQSFVSDQGLQYLRLAAVTGVDVLAVVAALWRERLVATRMRLVRERDRARLARREALELNDGIYQALFVARVWREMGELERSDEATDRAFRRTAALIEGLLEDVPLHPGALTQREPRLEKVGP